MEGLSHRELKSEQFPVHAFMSPHIRTFPWIEYFKTSDSKSIYCDPSLNVAVEYIGGI